MTELGVLIMAAGKGTRMKSDLAKTLHEIEGRPLVKFPERLARKIGAKKTIVVVGHQADKVKAVLEPETIVALQERQLGTGHAVQCAAPAFEGLEELVVLSGDVPLLQADTLRALVEARREEEAAAAVLTVVMEEPVAYGRVLRDPATGALRFVEAKDASEEEKAVREVSAGSYSFRVADLLEELYHLRADNAQGEYYLPDVLNLMGKKGKKVVAWRMSDPMECLGVNTPEDLDLLRREAASGKYALPPVN